YRVVKTRVGVNPGRGKSVAGRVVQVSVETRCAALFVIKRAAQGENLAIGQDDGVHFNARLTHRRPVLPDGGSRSHVDDLSSVGGGVSPSHDDDPGIVIILR